MSMFDYVQCDFPLGNEELQKLDYQTKDLDCLLSHYKIDENGRLWEHHIETEYDPYTEEEKQALLAEETFLSDFYIKRGKPRTVLDEWRPQDDFTGEIEFYSGVNYAPLIYPDNWVEFKAIFLHGYMQSLTATQMPMHLQKDRPTGSVPMPHIVGKLEVRYNGKTIADCDIVTEPGSTAELMAALRVLLGKLQASQAKDYE